MPFQCDRCGQCCRTHRVPLTATDLRRLAQHTGLDDLGAHVEWLASESVDFDDEPESFVELREGRRVPFLRHVPTASPTHASPSTPTSQCVFLGAHGCQVFPARPSACRSYPYDRPRSDRDKLHLTLAPEVQCPVDTDVFVTLHADPQLDSTARKFLDDVAQRDHELSSHAIWVSRHNSLMRLLTRMGKPRQSAAETLDRLLNPESDVE